MSAHVEQFTCLSDNFGVLIHDPATGATAAIDAPEAGPILAVLAARGWTLTHILITHKHDDHIQGIPGLKAKFPNAKVIAPKAEAAQIGAADVRVSEGDSVKVGSLEAKIIETPGHTLGHIVYWFEEEDILFAGDTLFAMGCGRVFETPMAVMYHSLMKLAQLPGDTQVYAGHEYTLANARFALSVDAGNDLLVTRAAEIEVLRKAGKATLPTTITLELATNPFLRADDREIQAALAMPNGDPVMVFAELRERKNRA